MRWTWLTLPSLICFGLVVWLLSTNLGMRDCINSRFVKKVVTDGSGQLSISALKSMRNCSSYPLNFSSSQSLTPLQIEVRQQLESINWLENLLPERLQAGPFVVVVVEEFEKPLLRNGFIIQFPKSQLSDSSALPRTLLFYVLRSYAKQAHGFFVGIYADFLYSLVGGGISKSVTAGGDQIPYHIDLKVSLRNYCNSNIASSDHLEFCAYQNGVSSFPSNVDQNGSTSLISSKLFEEQLLDFYNSLSIGNKVNFVRSMIEKLDQLSWSVPLVLPKDMSVKKWFFSEIYKLAEVLNWRSFTQDPIAIFNDRNSKPMQIEAALYSPSFSGQWPADNSDVRNHFVVDSNRNIWLRGLGKLNTLADEVEIKSMFFVGCGVLALNHEVFKINASRRLFYVDECDKEKSFDLEQKFFQDQLAEEIWKNDSIKFVEFFLPSVLYTIKHSNNLTASYSKQFSWESVRFEKSTKSFRPLAPVEGVIRFRN